MNHVSVFTSHRAAMRHSRYEGQRGPEFLISLFFLCACRRARRHTEEDLHEVGEQAFEKGETASRINSFSPLVLLPRAVVHAILAAHAIV